MTPSTSTKKSPVARRKLMAAQTAQRPKSGDSGKMLSAALIMGKRQKKVLAGKVGLSPAKVATEQSNGETLAMVTDEDVDMDISEDEGEARIDNQDQSFANRTSAKEEQLPRTTPRVQEGPVRTWPILGAPIHGSKRPSWWDSVEIEPEPETLTWSRGLSFCSSCRDGGTRLKDVPAVRCANCGKIYCVDVLGRGTRCVNVPAYAKNWLCVLCLLSIKRRPSVYPNAICLMAKSDMNMRYKTREHMPPSLPISLRPVLLLQVSCDFQDEFKSQSISALLWQLISHSYGSVLNDMISLVKITVTGKLNSLTSEHQAAKAAALDFLESHPDASVILFVDGHTFTQDGTVVYFDNESAPLSVLLLLCLGTNLWNAINASTGPIKLLVAMVCGWIWHWPQSVDQAGDVLRTWTYQTKNKKWTLPPLCKDAVGFSSTVVIPGVIASALASALEMAILFATPIDKAVLWRVGMSHELMRSTGIVLGTASEDNAPCFHILVRQSDYNIFGLPPVDNCPCCRERVEVHQSKLRKSGPQIKKRLRCSSCGLRTQWFEAPEAAMVPNELYLYRWPLPAPKPEWRWKDPSKDPSKDRARSVDILESP